jgi:hypothetical protein
MTDNLEEMKIQIKIIFTNLTKINNDMKKYLSNHEYNISKDKCYKPKTKEEIETIFRIYKIDDKIMIKIRNVFFSEFKKLNLMENKHNAFLFLCLYICALHNKKDEFINIMMYLNMRFYGNLLHKNMRYCQNNVIELTYKHLHGSHLYKTEGIYNAIKHNTLNITDRYYNQFKNKSLTRKDMVKFIYEIRHRTSQQLKYFLDRYYKIDIDLKNKNSDLYKKLIINDAKRFIKDFSPNVINSYFSYTIFNLNNNLNNNIYGINPSDNEIKLLNHILADFKLRFTPDDINKYISETFKPLLELGLNPVKYLNKKEYSSFLSNELTTRKNGLSLKSLVINWINHYVNDESLQKYNNFSIVTQRKIRVLIGLNIYDSIVDTIINDKQLYIKFLELRDILII